MAIRRSPSTEGLPRAVAVGAVCHRAFMDCARGFLFLPARFFCLKQGGQDAQDEQDERQVREALNVYSISRNKRLRSVRTLMSIDIGRNKRLRSERTLMCPESAFFV